MISKPYLYTLLKKEFATTLKVMRAYPESQMDFTPHERSSSAKKLMATFIFEMYLLRMNILSEEIDPEIFQTYSKDNLEELIADFESETKHVLSAIEDLSEMDLMRTFSFGGVDFTATTFTMMMLFDQIHHRGQLSVYVRMAGGKVPSIYGPSADDESTNL